MHKEYGGYLPIDTRSKEYFSNVAEDKLIRMNAARYAIIRAINSCNYSKVWIPIYMCFSVIEALESEEGINCDFYNINEKFEPKLENIGKTECILITNFYGQKDDEFYFEQIEKYKNVIFDNTQCFYANPILKSGIFNIYSPRKFFGVSDGAYLIGAEVDKILTNDLQEDISFNRVEFVFKSFEEGTNSCYKQYLEAEEDIERKGIKSMSRLTRALLGNIDYEGIKKKRKENYQVLCKKLDEINEIDVKYDVKSPMIYPLVIKREGLRRKLVENKIYIPQWWKIVLNNPKSNKWERYISNYLFPLPIDQRYETNDMMILADKVRNLL